MTGKAWKAEGEAVSVAAAGASAVEWAEDLAGVSAEDAEPRFQAAARTGLRPWSR